MDTCRKRQWDVYAYGSADMTALQPGESTSELIEQMTMRSITNAEYAAMNDINITITGYAMGTEGCLRFLQMRGMNVKR